MGQENLEKRLRNLKIASVVLGSVAGYAVYRMNRSTQKAIVAGAIVAGATYLVGKEVDNYRALESSETER